MCIGSKRGTYRAVSLCMPNLLNKNDKRVLQNMPIAYLSTLHSAVIQYNLMYFFDIAVFGRLLFQSHLNSATQNVTVVKSLYRVIH